MVELKNIERIYNKGTPDEVKALDDVTLHIEKGELLSIMGISGSGKSTLLHIIGCLDKPTSGKYYLDGVDTSTLNSNELSNIRNEKIGFVLQDYGLIEDKSALENVMYPLAFKSGVSYKQMKVRAENALDMVGITDNKRKNVSKLSGGQKQRVAIARAIVTDPALILCDEPTAALDHKTADKIMDLLITLNKSGKTVIIVTHDKRIADMCKRTVYISDGRISESDDK